MQRPGPSYALPGQATSAPPLGQIGWVRFQSATRAKLGQISSVELGHSQPGHRRSASRQMSVARDAICLCLFVDAQNQSCGAQEAGCKGASGLTVRKRKAVIRTGPLRGNVTRHREAGRLGKSKAVAGGQGRTVVDRSAVARQISARGGSGLIRRARRAPVCSLPFSRCSAGRARWRNTVGLDPPPR